MSPKSEKQFEEIRESSKENILNSALKLFSSKGFFNTSTRQISKQANVSNGLLYNYFKSKDELLVAIVNKAFKLLDNTIVSDTTIDAESRIHQTIERFFELLSTKQKMIKMMAQMGLQVDKFDFINKMIAKKYTQAIHQFTNDFKELNINNSEVEANILMATLDGIIFEVLVMGKIIPVEKMKKVLLEKYSKPKNT